MEFILNWKETKIQKISKVVFINDRIRISIFLYTNTTIYLKFILFNIFFISEPILKNNFLYFSSFHENIEDFYNFLKLYLYFIKKNFKINKILWPKL